MNIPQNEPYYPVNNEKNNKLYQKYKELADKEEKVIFGGRLGEYKYYDMDAVIEAAFRKAREVLWLAIIHGFFAFLIIVSTLIE